MVEQLSDVVNYKAASVEVVPFQSYIIGTFADLELWAVVAIQIWHCHVFLCCNLAELIETAVISVVIRAYRSLEGFPKGSESTSIVIGHCAFA